MKVRINKIKGHFYPEVKKNWRSEWKVLYIQYQAWQFCTLPEAMNCVDDNDFTYNRNRGYKTKEEALDILESYIGAGQSVIACDIVDRKDL